MLRWKTKRRPEDHHYILHTRLITTAIDPTFIQVNWFIPIAIRANNGQIRIMDKIADNFNVTSS